MPKLWNDTIDAHRRGVTDAILDAAAALAFQQGLRGVTMSQVAERAGIGRATLYKYFPDVETILRTWHGRRIEAHLGELVKVRDGQGSARDRLTAVLTAYAHIARQTGAHDRELVTFLHPDEQIVNARNQLRELIRALLEEAAAAGELRTDIPSTELAAYCLHALSAAADATSEAAVARLVTVTAAGLRAD
ncbi:helix-turn-helix domain-containing protein [Nocardia sp. CDC153]|uniref:TetR/AcrR family transcriptional regulator n=1 Tax=Nocardia sp. CDC153 TaxID=3112167 RepID=UPI002DBC859B|nr:helix-turn-helix domain-containing protein [Nocardia sp. CDC153]MEC3953653.1 helix-turn-helix domain-containing protein [Nocardia sp. CDC153]